MPVTVREGVRLYWKVEGNADAPALVLLNSIGTGMALWEDAVPRLGRHFQLLRIDTRGHGGSDAPPGDYSLDQLARDAAAIMDDAGISSAAIAGVSLGGMIAMQLGINAPRRVEALALICTSARMDRASWAARVDLVRDHGTAAIADMAVGRFLSPGLAALRPEIADALRNGVAAQALDGYAGAAAAIRDMDLADRLTTIAAPTLIVTATHDISTPLDGHGDLLLARIAGSRHVALDSAHLPPIEAPDALADALIAFLAPATAHAPMAAQ